MNARKLLLNEEVEVRQLEEGLGGSWHPGVVVGVSDLCRKVMYEELLCESGNSKLIESIPVTGAIEGLYQRPCAKFNYRGRIRPIPPPHQCAADAKLSFGVCVDVLFKEAWWEGVIFDCDEDAVERCIFFPDEGDERVFKLTDLRVTYEWDEFSGQWRERGVWMLVNLAKEHKKDGHIFRFIRRVWSRLKVHYGFQKMISDWTCGAYCVWKEYFREVIYDINTKAGGKGISFPNTSKVIAVKKRKHRSKRSKMNLFNASVLTRSMQKRKEKEVILAVRTRRMCMSDAEDSFVAAASNSGYLTDGHCLQSRQGPADGCIKNQISEAGDSGQFVSSQYRGLISSRILDDRCHHGKTSKNGSFSSGIPYMSENTQNSLKISKNNHFRRKWNLAEDKLKPRKLISARLPEHKLERHTSCVSKITRQVHDIVPVQFQDTDSVYKRKELMLRKKKVGSTMSTRYPVHRKGRRISVHRRNIVKKRSPKRIKRIYPRKTLEASISKPSLQRYLEVSKSEEKEGNWVEGIQSVANSCQEHRPEVTVDSPQKRKSKKNRCRDSVCLVCQYGGDLLHCDLCLSSYHLTCIYLEC